LQALLELAKRREVEATPLGEFNNSGRLRATYAGQTVLDLELEFLHEGTPLAPLQARWSPPATRLSSAAELAAALDEARLAREPGCVAQDLLDMLARPNMSSSEHI